MQGDSKQSIWLKLLTVAVFILFSAGSLAAFGYYAFQLILDLLHKEDVIAFNKGAMYMLGVGLSAGLLTYFMIYEIINRKISESFNKKATRLAFIFMGSIFIFPQIIDYGVRQYIGHTGTYIVQTSLIVGCMRRIWCLLPMRRLVRNSIKKRGRLGC